MAVLTLDTAGFLQAINRLERRFDELTSSNVNRDICKQPDGHGDANQRLYALASDVFGNGGLATTICVAAAARDGDLIYECKRFMTESAAIVRKHGMTAWLCNFIEASAKVLYMKNPSDRMPDIQSMGPQKLTVQRACVGRYCSKKANGRRAAIAHDERMRWFVAYNMLRWGKSELRSLEIAGMVLTHPRLGIRMLRDGNTAMALGISSDMRYRRASDYLQYLRVSADLDYARALADAGVPLLDGERAPGFVDVDRRYMYDAERLVEAYQSMWDDDERVHRTGCEILAEVERSGVRPDIPLWRNPAYLHDLAISLLGLSRASDLCAGFDRRDRVLFDKAVSQLRDFADFVRDIGVLMLPICVLQIYANRRLDEMMDHQPRHSKQTYDKSDYDATLNVGADMAAVAIARIPSENLARTLGLALLRREPSRYHELVLKCMGETVSANKAIECEFVSCYR